MLGLWAVLTLTGALYSAWLGYGGRAFAAPLTAFSFFFLVMLLFAARGVEDSLASRFGAGSGYLLGAAVFLVYLIYGFGAKNFTVPRSPPVLGLPFTPAALGRAMHFIEFAPQWSQWKSLPFLSLGILFFTAWPEEFLFRGLLQNMLARASKSDPAGWWTASILFGFSHITNMGFPNWRYVVLASLPRFFYGWTWRQTRSVFSP